jgi:uncharacterized protein with PIN domain
MTPQTVWKVDLGELSVIEVVCSQCQGATVSIPLVGNFPRSMKCPSCDKQWWEGIHDATFMAITKMIDGINYLRREGSKPFTVQFPC